ncbi:MAG: UvrD-helicase domain-containing protein [Planctomycetes bacterium]|nr:UvrD-helicase domain-containing protein [Planctomycetota bacterium]
MSKPGMLIEANAGCGKTYSLANRVIGWMVAHLRAVGDAGATGILAATFTRKAAGEIQERILSHLAEGAADPALLEGFQDSIGVDPPARCEELQQVLEEFVRVLDRLQISTLDGIFHRLAKAFPDDVGLPEGWTIADRPALERLQREAIDAWLSRCDDDELQALAMEAEGEILKGSPHGSMIGTLWGTAGGGLLSLWRASQHFDGSAPAWDWLESCSDDDISPTAAWQTSEALAAAINALGRADLPPNKDGSEPKVWVNARDRVVSQALESNWRDVLEDTLVVAVVNGAKFSSKNAPSDFEAALQPIVSHARADLMRRARLRVRVWSNLLRTLDDQYRRHQRSTGQYDYADITDQLVQADLLSEVGGDVLAWRLDSTIRDLALDEFQDTSVPQWKVIEPVIEEIFAGEGAHETPRHLLVVADPKQSIYAWRGGTPDVLRSVKQAGGEQLETGELARSYRSAPEIMAFVNEAFGTIDTNAALDGAADKHPAVPDEVMQRAGLPKVNPGGPVAEVRSGWHCPAHASARTELAGDVAAWLSPKDDDAHLEYVADIIEDRAAVGAGVGVLCPTNGQVADLSHELRMRGVAVSEEGAGGAASIPAVAAMLDVLRFASHPGDRAAAFRVSHSPLGPMIGLHPLETIAKKERDATLERISLGIRSRIAKEGLSETLATLVRQSGDSCDARGQFSLRLVADRAAEWEEGGPRDTMDFVRTIEQTGFGAPSDAAVRIMTQHKAKGLEFDEVVLPWLDRPMAKARQMPCFPFSGDPLEPPLAMAPEVSQKQRVHAPVLEAFQNQSWAAGLADSLSLLYVSITRPRTGLHLVFRPSDKDPQEQLTSATFLRAAIDDLNRNFSKAVDEIDTRPKEPFWTRSGGAFQTSGGGEASQAAESVSLVRIRVSDVPTVLAPSSHEQTGSIADRWPLLPGRARRDGVILHELFRLVRWLDDGPVDDAAIERAFDEAALQLGRPVGSDLRAALQTRFMESLGGPVGAALRREMHAAWKVETLEAIPEHPILVQTETGVIRGRIDRLVLGKDSSGAVVRAAILDFKTGHAETEAELQAAREWYQPQLDRYAEGVAAIYGLPLESIDTGLLFVG